MVFAVPGKMQWLLLTWSFLHLLNHTPALGQNPQVLIESSSSTNSIPVLTNVTLRCSAAPLPLGRYHYYEWLAEGGAVMVSRLRNQSTLEVPHFRVQHSGLYRCAVYWGSGDLIGQASVTLTATGAALAVSHPYFHAIPDGATVETRGHSQVFCYYTTELNGSMGWSNASNNHRFPQLASSKQWELKSTVDNLRKVITLRTSGDGVKLSLFHKGSYFCNAGAGYSLTLHLRPVSAAPVITTARQGRYLYPSTPLGILCETPNDYSPSPQFTWLFNGENIENIVTPAGSPSGPGGGHQSPFNVTLFSRAQNYYQTSIQFNLLHFTADFPLHGVLSCVVSNALGRTSADLLIEPRGTRIITRRAGWPEQVHKMVGNALRLSIDAAGTYSDIAWLLDGAVLVVWFGGNNSVTLHNSCEGQRCRISDFGRTLIVDSLGSEHRGRIEAKLFVNFELCSEYGGGFCQGEMVSFQVEVYGPPVVTVSRNDVPGMPPSQLALLCTAEGYPPPALRWKQNGSLIQTGSKFQIENSESTSRLVVQSPSWATYTCEGSNQNPMLSEPGHMTGSDSYLYGVSLTSTGGVCSNPSGADPSIVGALAALVAVMVAAMGFLLILVAVIVYRFRRRTVEKKESNYSDATSNPLPRQRRHQVVSEAENDYVAMTPAPIAATPTSATHLPLPSTPTLSVSSLGNFKTPPSVTSYVSHKEIERTRTAIVEEVNV